MNREQKLGILLIVVGLVSECTVLLNPHITGSVQITIGGQSTPSPQVAARPPANPPPTTNPVEASVPCPQGQHFDDLAWSPDGQRILFSATWPGYAGGIGTIHADGSNLIRLTAGSTSQIARGWSPDGQKILYETYGPGAISLWVMNADPSGPVSPGPAGSGSGQTLLDTVAMPHTGSWSPKPGSDGHGGRVAFSSGLNGAPNLYLINADGSDRTTLTDTPLASYSNPVWSPDGTRIAYTWNDDLKAGVAVIDADPLVAKSGPAPAPLTSASESPGPPVWSLDGTQILYTLEDYANGWRIRTVDAEIGRHGYGKRRRDLAGAFSYDPFWLAGPEAAGEGARIAYISRDSGGINWISVMNRDGTGVVRITPSAGTSLAGSPDGKQIAFVGWTGNDLDIYRINIDGSNLVRLTNNPRTTRCN